MQERQVTLAGDTRRLPDPFLVLATQNPVEQEGTYALPEAQIDRFMVKLVVGYPTKQEELRIIDRMSGLGAVTEVKPATTPQDLLRMRALLDTIYLDDKVKGYIVDLVFATREPEQVGLAKLRPLILYGASPRASLALARASRARAFLEGRGFVTPQDVKAVGTMVLRHRVLTTYEAEAEGITSEQVLKQVFDTVRVP
jgi:MoxR-like ATPase